MSSKRKNTMTTKVASGSHHRTFRLDGATEARLAYLVAFYWEVLGEKTSGSGLVRRAVELLTDKAQDIIRLKRGLELEDILSEERGGMRRAVEGEKAPFKSAALEKLASGEAFPTTDELRRAGQTAADVAAEARAEVREMLGLPRAEEDAEVMSEESGPAA